MVARKDLLCTLDEVRICIILELTVNHMLHVYQIIHCSGIHDIMVDDGLWKSNTKTFAGAVKLVACCGAEHWKISP